MDRRPKLWMHRTFRFWWGFGLLLLVFAAWLGSMSFSISIGCNHYSATSITCYWVGLDSGGARGLIERWDWNTPPPRWGDRWEIRRDRRPGVILRPRLSRSKINGPPQTVEFDTAFLPLWVPLLAWAVCWPLWMHRADKKEARHFREMLAPRESADAD
ncbi:hypothetical protein [Luteolibacter marinus]|uniref:hypothetical protein n=1 Tax=Luteolibacter marinus TaxID=2776705 RepID=UPI001865F963|nr:hypothetical protein [Luteolibacter marinus]